MKYSKAQLNAISRSKSIKNEQRRERIAREAGLWNEWKTQTKYKTLNGFLKSKAQNGKINNEYV